MSLDQTHLLSLPVEQRAMICMSDLFLFRPEANRVVDNFKRSLRIPRSVYNPGMSLVADGGQGKSTLGQWISEESCRVDSDWPGAVLYIDLVRNVTNLDLTKLMLMEIGTRFGNGPLNRSYRNLAKAESIIRERNILGAVIDEVPQIWKSLPVKRCEAEHGALKGFSGGNWKLNLMLLGTPHHMDKVFESDSTLASRFGGSRKCIWPSFELRKVSGEKQQSEERRRLLVFVRSYVKQLPLLKESVIDMTFCIRLLKLSQVIVAEEKIRRLYSPVRTIVDLLKESARVAILSGDESITLQTLDCASKCMQALAEAPEYRDQYTQINTSNI